ncbi:MBL fold metallo-hydrolase [Paenarthrobacter sp. NPDC089714]|uniref:MBL fold metallo-hydrolase n=1 Tax=Paenarthrobacter sp. NPDC089714 TaxID=3364377 RepID=UPI0038107508
MTTTTNTTHAPVRNSYGDGAVEVLGLPIDLDGRTAIQPLTARGTTYMNVVLFKGATHALLADTGMTSQLPEITNWLDNALPAELPLSVFPLRLTEFDSVSNVVPLVDRYKAARLFASQYQGFYWFDFRVEGYGDDWSVKAQYEKAPFAGEIPLGSDGTHDLEIFQPDLALLQTHWIFDPTTGTLATSDAFGHVKDLAVRTETGISAEEKEAIRQQMVGNRFWWLPGARTEGIADAVRAVFANRDVQRIVPAHGAILEGRDVVREHVDLILALLEEFAQEDPASPPATDRPLADLPRQINPTPGIPAPSEGKLPRQLQSGVTWLGDCLEQRYQGKYYHAYNSVYVVSGAERSLIVEGGFPGDLATIEKQLDELLASGIPPVEYIFATHSETPHASGVGRFLKKFPDAVAIGGVHDLHQVFPEYADRIHVPGTETIDVDLGDRRFYALPPILRDVEMTYWGFDSGSNTLFPGDGFSYSHYHQDGHCGLVAEEAGSLEIPDMTALFAELALAWTRYTDLEPYIKALDQMLSDLEVTHVAPTHGLPITNLSQTVPEVIDGLRLGASL